MKQLQYSSSSAAVCLLKTKGVEEEEELELSEHKLNPKATWTYCKTVGECSDKRIFGYIIVTILLFFMNTLKDW